MRKLTIFVLFVLIAIGGASLAHSQTASTPPQTSSVVPNFVKFSGTAKDVSGKPLAGVVGVTFSLYQEENGVAALWMETQNVHADASGHYNVSLGTEKPLSVELFASGEARWLGVQVAEQAEQPRILLLSVPYALKAADAETLGGKPASAFLQANAQQTDVAERKGAGPQKLPPNVHGNGTISYLPLWTATNIIDKSSLFQSGGNVGVGTTTPATLFDVNGTSSIRNTLTLFGTATTPALALSGTPFNLSNTGIITFVPGQTFPGQGGSGTVTSVGLSAPTSDFTVSGSPITSAGTLGLAWTVPPASANTANAIVKRDSLGNFTTNSVTASSVISSALSATTISAGSGTFTGTVTAAGDLLPASGTATASQGYTSQPLDSAASVFNSSTAMAQNEDFRWLAEPVGNNTSSPSGKLDLLFGANGATPAETGLAIAGNGQITFASGQSFPGTGTITGVTAGTDLTGGGTSGNVTLNLNTAALQASNDARYAQLNANNTFTKTMTFAAGQTFPGAGSVSSVALAAPTSDFTVSGSPITGSGTLSLGWNVAPTSANTANSIVKRDSAGNFSASGVSTNAVTTSAISAVTPLGGGNGPAVQASSVASAGVAVSGTGGLVGVYGSTIGSGGGANGVQGSSTNATAVRGDDAGGGSGVVGTSSTGYGVSGTSSNVGVYGHTTGAGGSVNGVQGASTNATAVRGDDAGGGSGVVGTSSGGYGVYGSSGTGFGFGTNSNVQQARGMGGWAKAMIFVDPFTSSGTAITRCYNSQASGATVWTPPCGITVTHERQGEDLIDFGFQVNDRFIMGSPFFSVTLQTCVLDPDNSCLIEGFFPLTATQVDTYTIANGSNASDVAFWIIVF